MLIYLAPIINRGNPLLYAVKIIFVLFHIFGASFQIHGFIILLILRHPNTEILFIIRPNSRPFTRIEQTSPIYWGIYIY